MRMGMAPSCKDKDRYRDGTALPHEDRDGATTRGWKQGQDHWMGPPHEDEGYHTRTRTETGTSVNRTPIASVVTMNRDTNVSTGTTGGSENVGYRVRNVFGRDGGRTQSGGVRGIVAADIDDF